MDIRNFFGAPKRPSTSGLTRRPSATSSHVSSAVEDVEVPLPVQPSENPSHHGVPSLFKRLPEPIPAPAARSPTLLLVEEDDTNSGNAPKSADTLRRPAKRKAGPVELPSSAELDAKRPKHQEIVVSESAQPPLHPPPVTEPSIPRSGSSYRAYLSRAGPPQLGLKELPIGAPDCLKGKKFLITGVLDSLTRDQAEELIRRYGGDVAKSVIKKLDFAIVGTEPGVSKIEKLVSQNVSQLSESGLFELIASTQDRASGALTSSPVVAHRSGPQAVDSSPDAISRDSEAPGGSILSQKSAKPPSRSSEVPEAGWLLSEKYRPTKLAELIGFTLTDQNPIKQLKDWLQYWAARPTGAGELVKPRACLITGPPGIGKTSAAKVIAKECGFETREMNASDTRSKNSIRDSVAQTLSTHSIAGYFPGLAPAGISSCSPLRRILTVPDKLLAGSRLVLIMDEVDGMSTGDRGGLAELVQLIKSTKTPIICIANDKYKVRSLDNHCLRIGFRRPTAQQISAKLAQIAFREGISAPEGVRKQLAEECHGDVRQAINLLQLWSTGGATHITFGMNRRKDVTLGPFDAVPPLLSDSLHRFDEKLERFFVDYSLVPLFVQENYLGIVPDRALHRVADLLAKRAGAPAQVTPSTIVLNARASRLFADSADSISLGDLLERNIRRDQHWELLPSYGSVSAVRPCAILKGRFAPTASSWVGGGLQFPTWLGKNSSTTKHLRLVQEIQSALCLHTAGTSARGIRLDYCQFLAQQLTTPLLSGAAGITLILQVMEAYQLQKDTRDAVLELLLHKDPAVDAVPSAVKSALTRQINKAHWAVSSVSSSKRLSTAEKVNPNDPELGEVLLDDEEEVQEPVEDLPNDRLVKEKKKRAPTKKTAKR